MSEQINEAAVTEAVARAFGRPTRLTESQAQEELALARAFGREPHPEAQEFAAQEMREQARRAVGEGTSAPIGGPWYEATTWGERTELQAAEAQFVSLVSSRRGQTTDAAREYVERTLREAWHRPTVNSASEERKAAVKHALREGIQRLSNLAPIAKEAGR